MWKVAIRNIESNEIVEKINCSSEHMAGKVEDGVNINLNHEDYITEVIEED